MNKSIFVICLFTTLLLLESMAFAQEESASDTKTVMASTDPAKEVAKPKLGSKSLVRTIGGSRIFAPGQKKKEAGTKSAKEFAPGQVKKTTGTVSAKGFVPAPADISARKRKIFEEAAKKLKPQKPLKGYKKSFRGEPYKPKKA